MKTKIATALSIVGVLGAGSAAALVNTEILDSGPTTAGASAAVLPPASSIELTVPTTPVTLPSVPSTSVAASASDDATPAITVPAASGFLTAFEVGEAGVVTVDVIDGRLLLVSAEPKSGWTVTKAEDDRDDDSTEPEDEVEVEFTSATVLVEFEAHLVDGQIVPEVHSTAIGGSTGPAQPATGGGPAPSTTVDHDDDSYDDSDDDSYDDDSYDDSDDSDDVDDEDEDDGEHDDAGDDHEDDGRDDD